jgi:hypothetical protein
MKRLSTNAITYIYQEPTILYRRRLLLTESRDHGHPDDAFIRSDYPIFNPEVSEVVAATS